MKIDLFLSPAEIQPDKIKDRIAVIIDVLRASTSIIIALANGCRGISAVAEIEEAKKLAHKFPPESILLGGERNELLIPGFDLSNSPQEYTVERVKDKKIIFTSSNGSKLFKYGGDAYKTIVGAFVNVTILSEFIRENNTNVTILCAGKNDQFCMEDAVCGGMIIEKMINKITDKLILNDGAIAAHILYQVYANNILEMLYQVSHGKRLIEIGREADLVECGQIDSIETIPILSGNELVPLSNWHNGAVENR